MVSGRAERRAQARTLRAAGVAAVARRVIPTEEASNLDRIVFEVGLALHDLHREGGDVTSRLAVTVGSDHPSYPAATIVEAKASAVRTRTVTVDPDRDDAGS